MEQWAEPFVKLRLPHIVSLRRDPFERADFNSNTYFDWMVDHVPQLYLMQAVVAQQIEDFAKFPPRQKPASFNLDSVLAAGSDAARLTPHLAAPTGRGFAASFFYRAAGPLGAGADQCMMTPEIDAQVERFYEDTQLSQASMT